MVNAKFVILDRNAVALIKDSNAGVAQNDPKKIKFLTLLRSIDRKGVAIASLFSIMEGEKGRADTVEEKIRCIQVETDALRSFYKNARTDGEFLKPDSATAELLSGASKERVSAAREDFYRIACPLIAFPVRKNDRKQTQEKLI